jgi:hypothetical protein
MSNQTAIPDSQPNSAASSAQSINSDRHPEPTGFKKFLSRSRVLFIVLFYLAILGIAIVIKFSYRTFDTEGYFRDSASYASSADLPLSSLQFWAGVRPFTIPLFYKIMGVGAQNYKLPAVMQRVAVVQALISLLCWSLLGVSISLRVRNRWLGGIIFGLVLAFSLVYEISRWDLLMLSESASFSLFALLLAGWIELLGMPGASRKSPRAYLILAAVIIVTVLYSFTRDPNMYFVVMCAVLFAVASLFRKLELPRALTLIYLVAAILLYFGQNASSDTGNRWQIFIYDHLALRLTDTPAFVTAFTTAGLPNINELYKPADMRGSVYEDMLLYAPKFEAMRQWIKEHGKATYIKYLLTNPGMTLSQPLIYVTQILNGTAEEVLYHSYEGAYRKPLHTKQFVPRWMRLLTKAVFPTVPGWAYGILYLGFLGLSGWALWRGWNTVLWLVIAALLITLYPYMILIWFGDPLEIGRHALQIAISLRLAGILALALTVDRWLYLRRKKAAQSTLTV